MTEIRVLDEKKSKELRLKRAHLLADLYTNKNSNLLEALESFLAAKEYEFLLMIKNSDDKREQARGMCDLVATLLSSIKEEINWAIKELEKSKKGKKGD